MKKILLIAALSLLSLGSVSAQTLNSSCSGTESSVASTCVRRDSNQNTFANSFVNAGQSVVTSASPIALTVASPFNLVLTGSTAQTISMPDATTLTANQSSSYIINNSSSATATINDASGGLLYSLPAGGYIRLNLLTKASAAGTWDVHPAAPSIATWGSGVTGLQMNNALNTTAQIGSGASSCTTPNIIPRRANSTTGFGSSSASNVCGVANGITTFSSTSTSFGIASGTYQVGGVQIGPGDLAPQAANTLVGNSTGSSASPTALPAATVQAMVQSNQYFLTPVSVNFNSANTDFALPVSLPTGFTKYLVNGFRIYGASGTLSTSTFGVFDAIGGGGNVIVAGGTGNTITSTTDGATNNAMGFASVTANTATRTIAGYPNIYFRVQTPQGSAATASVTMLIVALP